MLKCLICNKECENLRAHIQIHGLTSEEYRNKFNYNGNMQINKHQVINSIDKDLLNSIVNFYINDNNSLKDTANKFNMSTSSITRILQNNNIKKPRNNRYDVRKRNNLLKYGVESTNQLKEKKENLKQSLMHKYGVTNVFQLDKVKNAIKTLILKNME